MRQVKYRKPCVSCGNTFYNNLSQNWSVFWNTFICSKCKKKELEEAQE